MHIIVRSLWKIVACRYMSWQSEIPNEYGGLVCCFGEPTGTDMKDYDSDHLYKLNEFHSEDFERYYFTESSYFPAFSILMK